MDAAIRAWKILVSISTTVDRLLMMPVPHSFGLNSEDTLLGGPWVEHPKDHGRISARCCSGYYTDDAKLIYAGRVGTGMPVALRSAIRKMMKMKEYEICRPLPQMH
jgi:hypothetical protein